MRQMLLLLGCLGYVACQGPVAGNGTNGTQPACDPFLNNCPGSNCPTEEAVGRLHMIMPGTRAYAYVGNPIDIVWEYFPNTDNVTFPRNNFVFYYKKKGDTGWKDIAAIPKGNITKNSYRWTPSEQLLKDTRYELLILVDNVSAVLNGPGNKPSCWAPGFPVAYAQEFVVLNPPSAPSDPNNPDKCSKYCPSESRAESISSFIYGEFLLYLELLAGIYFLFEF